MVADTAGSSTCYGVNEPEKIRAASSAVEHLVDIEGVTSSNLVPPTKHPMGPFHLSRDEIIKWWDGLDEARKTPTPTARTPTGADSYVYFIQCGGLVKIGVATDVRGRLATLQTGNPAELRLLLCIPGDKNLENELHARFYAYSVEREWFHLSDEIKSFINAQNTPTEFS